MYVQQVDFEGFIFPQISYNNSRTKNLSREKPKVIKAAEKKTARSDGEPEAKRRKVDVNETTVVQEVCQLDMYITKLIL